MTDHTNPKDYPVWANEKVEIISPSSEWIEIGIQESKQLINLLSPLGIIEVEHIGSTSVSGLPAKPIIDLMANLRTFDDIDKIIEVLSDYDWHYVAPELDLRPWRRFFVKVKNDKRIAHLHLMCEGEERWNQQRLFRDKLKKDKNLVEQYATLKMALSHQYKNDREAYSEAKKNFIINILNS
ncbi:GrpB family protein [Paenibacillus sp. L3-i20]|uniref:GrpB family protein n=1 Tax=Paenibacillus sp. L3-i20 TaxID=2905833 RepID=UPI001EE0F3E9|nr:GrpB family protein [Paenibacillus sp. L3-i20]GKU78973.1 hypothetical protein L3i20_v233700 [Paenibacillus sp. L3-i20]